MEQDAEVSEVETDEEDRMGLEEAMLLAGKTGKKRSKNEDDLGAMEADYRAKGGEQRAQKKEKKGLLPLKTKSGLVFQEGEEMEESDVVSACVSCNCCCCCDSRKAGSVAGFR